MEGESLADRFSKLNLEMLGETGPDNLAAALLDAIPAHVAVLDLAGRIVAVNEAWRRFWRENQTRERRLDPGCGVGVDYLFTCRSSVGFGADEARAVAAGIEAILAGGRDGFSLEYPCDSASGRQWFRLEASRLGKIAGCLVAHWDITSKRLQAEALRKSEERFRGVVEDQTEIISRFQGDGTFIFANEVYCRFFGKTPEQLIGSNWHPVVYPEDVPEIMAALARLTPRTPVVTIENRVYSGTGALRWMQFVNRAFFDDAGQLREIQSVGRDITERKEAEAALRDSELRYQTMVDALSEGVLVYGPDGRIRVSNPAASRILGLSREQMIGAGQADPGWTACGEDMRPLDVADLPVTQSLREGASVHGAVIGLDRPDGTRVWLSINSEPIRSARPGEPSGVIATFNDITRAKQTEMAMTALRKEMQDLVEWQLAAQTAASIAHELNQPLNAITTFGEAALMRMASLTPPPEKLAKAVEGMVGQAERAGRMLRELMSYFRKTESPMETFDLNALLEETVILTRASGFGQFDITVARAPGLKPVLANRLRIGKVCLNLLRNGMEAMAASGADAGNSAIRIQVFDAGDHARVSIHDAGPGLDKDTGRRIFEPFFSTKSGGIGMGLTISRSLVEAHGGKLWFDPAPDSGQGRGAVFHFTLPFAP